MALEETVRLRTAELQAANAEISRRMEIQTEQAHQIESANKDLQTTNAQLDEANRLKTQLLSMAAHDLKNPLSAIIGLSEIALADVPKHTPSWEMLGHIQTTAERMGLLIKDLLDAATIELGNIALHHSNVALPLLAHSIADRYHLNAEQKNLRIKVETEEEIIVSADAARLEQVFDNLISNAVKYSPPDKTIYVRVKRIGSNARIEVQDEGPGISAEDQKKLFGFFQRLSARPTGGESSNGVGLAIVRKIVDLHGGTIWVHSELGKGATFIMELPLA
jgi:signal transduction histidine kinase